MEQVKHNTAAGDSLKLYVSPRTKVVFLKTHEVLCVSNPEKYSPEMTEGDDNW